MAMGKDMCVLLTMAMLCSSYLVRVGANDPDPLQDLCVAHNLQYINVNGFPCKPSEKVTADDFFFYRGLAMPGNTNNMFGSNVSAANVQQIAGLNTLGVSMARIDYAAHGGLNPPHTHPRATEILLVIEGTLNVGFVTTDTPPRLFKKTLQKGDVFVFPRALVHFQQNVAPYNAVAIAAFNSQLPGTQVIPQALFGVVPPIDDQVLAKAFQIEPKVVDELQAIFRPSSPK